MGNEEKIEINRLLRFGLLVILTAVVLNSSVYIFANIFGIFNDEIINPNTNNPIHMSEIIIVSIYQMVIGLVGFALASEVFKEPIRIYRNMASLFLLISFFIPFTVKNVTLPVIISLELMHLISGFLMIKVLPRLVVSDQNLKQKKMKTEL